MKLIVSRIRPLYVFEKTVRILLLSWFRLSLTLFFIGRDLWNVLTLVQCYGEIHFTLHSYFRPVALPFIAGS